MIAHLRGRLLDRQPTRLVIDVGGIGLEVLVPLATAQEAGEPGAEVSLHTVLVVREESLTLYGFSVEDQRRLFLKLTGVSGIGPKLALNALSGSPPGELVRAIRERDLAFLTRLPGIGKKTAERLALELKDALGEVAGEATTASGPERDAIEALVSLGYARNVAERSIRGAAGGEAATSVESLLRTALAALTGSGKSGT